MEEYIREGETGSCGDIYKIDRTLRTVSSGGCPNGIPRIRAGGNPCYARFGNNGKLFCYGKKYGARGHADLRSGNAYNPVQRIYTDGVDLCASEFEADLRNLK